jgi:hypothetical protein
VNPNFASVTQSLNFIQIKKQVIRFFIIRDVFPLEVARPVRVTVLQRKNPDLNEQIGVSDLAPGSPGAAAARFSRRERSAAT